MTPFEFLFRLGASACAAALGVYVVRALRTVLETGRAGTMRGRIRRETRPVAFWSVVVVCVLMILTAFLTSFLLVAGFLLP